MMKIGVTLRNPMTIGKKSGLNSMAALFLMLYCLSSLTAVANCAYAYTKNDNPAFVSNTSQNSQLASDMQYILNGVQNVNYGSSSFGSFLYSKNLYYPIGFSGVKPFMLCGRFGSGKILLAGHQTVLGSTDLDNPTLIKNVFTWMAGTKTNYNVGLFLSSSWNDFGVLAKLPATITKKSILTQADFAGQDLVIVPYFSNRPKGYTEDILNQLATYVSNGGNIIFASVGWPWRYYGEGSTNKSLVYENDFMGSMILKRFDAFLTQDALKVGNYSFASIKNIDNTVIDFLTNDLMNVLNGTSLQFTADSATVDSYIKQIQMTVRFEYICSVDLYNQLVDALVASPRFNIETNFNKISGTNAFYMQVFRIMNELSYAIYPEYCRALPPSLNIYPGKPASQIIPSLIVSVPQNKTKRIYTGLNIGAGEVIKVRSNHTFSELSTNVKLIVNQNFDMSGSGNGNLKRYPDIRRYFDLKIGEFLIASPHGGLLYFEVSSPKNLTLNIEILGAYEAPYFNEEIHTQDDFNRIKLIKAPFFVFETIRFVIVGRGGDALINSTTVNVTRLSNFWNTVMSWYKDFRGSEPFPFQKDSVFCDANIRAGFMHSGYPVMTQGDAALGFIGVSGDIVQNGGWGIYHEFGHNHQDGKWTPSNCGEVTNNVYSLYLFYKMQGVAALTNPWFGKSMSTKIQNLLSVPVDQRYTKFSSDAGLALYMFAILIDEWGFDVFNAMQKNYNVLTADLSSDVKKWDQLVIQLAQVTKLNAWKYFTNWGIPVTSSSLDAVSTLPEYTCKNYPAFTA